VVTCSEFGESAGALINIAFTTSYCHRPLSEVIQYYSSMSTGEKLRVTTAAPSPSGEGSGLHIPEARDGFFGYPEEKSLQHVRFRIAGWIPQEIMFTVSRYVARPCRSRRNTGLTDGVPMHLRMDLLRAASNYQLSSHPEIRLPPTSPFRKRRPF
jgi:hypothetical protein